MTPRDEDEAWREIVDNYGDQPDVDDADHRRSNPSRPGPGLDPAPGRGAGPGPDDPDDRRWSLPRPDARQDPYDPDPWEDEGRFVPPTPPPLPRPAPRRQIAWLGIFLAPMILLVSVVFGWSMPGWLSLLFVLWFMGGFIYLVSEMPPGPRDPGDNGARL